VGRGVGDEKVDRGDTAREVKKLTGNGHLRVKRIPRRIRKRLATLRKLGRWEKLALACVQELGLEYQFRIADIVICIERKYGIQNHGGHLNRKIFDAVKRLVDRKVVVKKGRGVYALRKELARVSALGFPLVVEPVVFLSQDTEKYYKALRKAVKNHVNSSSKNKENLFSARDTVSGSSVSNISNDSNSITSVGNGFTNYGNNGDNDSVNLNGIGINDFVVRAHVFNPRNGWVGYYMSVSVAFHVLGFVRGLVREYLAELYGETFVGNLDKSIEAVAESLPNAEFVIGCHGRYGTSPGSFSPLTPRCEVHSYEYGVDVILPAALSDVLRDVSFIKIYVKEISTNGYPREAQYRSNDIRKFL
jgi:hypothetical protein